MKRVLVLTLALVLAVTTMITGTVAYLTSVDQDVNVMTVGNVEIKQHELQRKEGVAHNKKDTVVGDLVDFVQGQPLYPAVALDNTAYTAEPDDLFMWGPYVHTGTAGNGLWNDNKLFGAMDKMIFVENTGDSDCYYRTWIAFECPEGMEYSEGSDKEFMMNVNGSSLYQWETIGYTKIGDIRYLVECATYVDALKPGELSHPSLLQVVMTHNATNEDMELLGDSYEILALTQAVQTNNMTEAYNGLADNDKKAYTSAADFALTTAFTNDIPWTDVEIPNLVASADDLVEALEAGEDVIFANDIKINPASMSNAYGTTGINVKNGQAIYGGGHTLDIKGAGGTWDSGINTTGGIIKDLTVTGSFRGIFINHNSTHSEPVVLENVTIDGTTYTVSCDQGLYQTLDAKNSTFKGWTSFAETLGSATFENCYFGRGNGYAYMRPYAPATYIGCKFEAGYKVDPRADVLFVNCTFGDQPLTADNVASLVTNIAKVTVM